MSTGGRERFEVEAGKKILKREADHVVADRRHLLGPPGTLNTITPCAACKLLRRRCAQECPFSPYFSPHEPQKFASVHKVFGASNVSKMLTVNPIATAAQEVPEPQRADAANSLVFEANIRLRDPVYGCMGAISALQQQVQALEEELRALRAEILKHKYRQNSASHVIPPPANSNAAALVVTTGREVSVAVPPPPVPTPTPPAPSTSSSSMYTPPSSSTDYSSITNENVTYYG